MRESYLERVSFRREAESIARRSAALGRESFTPGATALLVIDMQGYFLNPKSHAFLPAAGSIIPGVSALARAFSGVGLPVIFTRHLNTERDAGSLGTWWNDLISAEHPLSAISDELDTTLGSIIEKTQYDALHETGLGARLRERGVTRVVITGVATHLCCETTARSAFVQGFQVTFPFDGTATYDEHHHLASLLNLSHGFATIASVDELLKAVSQE
ncbi:MAG: isochorismatase family protein [Candidatus Eisenbacteria bacterium]|nr:isochorismatase family protein [Candidatus Eisenbacteria bacterium]